MIEFRALEAQEVSCRIGQKANDGSWITVLLYKDQRVDSSILDETVGSENWQDKYYECKGNLFCSVGIRCKDEWVWKDNCGTESFSEAEKGEASDAFKRACFNWGIGKELYTAPLIYIPQTDKKTGAENYALDNNGRPKVDLVCTYLNVENRGRNKVITGLNIENNKKKRTVFAWGNIE